MQRFYPWVFCSWYWNKKLRCFTLHRFLPHQSTRSGSPHSLLRSRYALPFYCFIENPLTKTIEMGISGHSLCIWTFCYLACKVVLRGHNSAVAVSADNPPYYVLSFVISLFSSSCDCCVAPRAAKLWKHEFLSRTFQHKLTLQGDGIFVKPSHW
jgi:hypothetical protein